MKSIAFPTCFWHPVHEVRVLVHGDDFVVLADQQGQSYVETLLRSQYDLRVDGSLGPGETNHDSPFSTGLCPLMSTQVVWPPFGRSI